MTLTDLRLTPAGDVAHQHLVGAEWMAIGAARGGMLDEFTCGTEPEVNIVNLAPPPHWGIVHMYQIMGPN